MAHDQKGGAHNIANVPLTLKTMFLKLLIYPNKPNIYINFLKKNIIKDLFDISILINKNVGCYNKTPKDFGAN